MKNIILILSVILISGATFAGTHCDSNTDFSQSTNNDLNANTKSVSTHSTAETTTTTTTTTTEGTKSKTGNK